MQIPHQLRKTRLVVPILVASVALAACGSSSKSTSTSASSPASSGAQVVKSSKIPAKTIGVWQSQADGEGEETTLAGVKAAAAAVGWKTIVTDANGNPQAMGSTMQTLIADHVNAIVCDFVDTGLITAQLAQAKAAGIPVIALGFEGTPSPDLSAMYAPNSSLEAKMILARMHKVIPQGGQVAPVAVTGYYGIDQELAQLHASASQYHLDVLNTIDAPVDNVFDGQTQAAQSFLNGYPKLAAFYSALDIGVQTISPALTQLHRNVPIFGFSAIDSAMPFIKQGLATVVTSDGTEKSGWVAVDSLLAYWIHKTPIPATVPADDAFQYKIVDKANAPQGNAPAYPPSVYAKMFEARWTKEYGSAA